ncbi:MAG: SpoIIE family protein phosphatase [Candidatus Omnitrophota bacterium]
MKPPKSGSVKAKVLVAESEATILEWLCDVLSHAGFDVAPASDGDDALRVCRAAAINIVLADASLSGMNGYELCHWLKRYYVGDFIPVILMTRFPDIQKGVECGADEYVIKPVRSDEVIARINAMLRIQELHRRLLKEYRMLDDEFRTVGQIQRSLLPKIVPSYPGFQIAAHYEPCGRAGGDFYDILELDRNKWAFCIGDVVGHGSPAALVMAITMQILRMFVGAVQRPKTVMTVMNEALERHIPQGYMVTMFYALLDLEEKTLVYSSAGHAPPFVVHANARDMEWLQSEKGMPLGASESNDFDEISFLLKEGDLLICYTDGIVELRDEERQFFGEERLVRRIVNSYGRTLPSILTDVMQEADAFVKQNKKPDDLALFALQYYGEKDPPLVS